ncbi:MAG: DUF2871 family protein [Bacilli bacterium]
MNKPDKKYIIWSLSYLIAGLAAGVYYREFSKAFGYVNSYTPLGLAHPHLLVLGMIMMIIFGFLSESLLSKSKHQTIAFSLYNAGVISTALMLIIRGTFDVMSKGSDFVLPTAAGKVISIFSGVSHVVLAAGIIYYFVLFIKSYSNKGKAENQ